MRFLISLRAEPVGSMGRRKFERKVNDKSSLVGNLQQQMVTKEVETLASRVLFHKQRM